MNTASEDRVKVSERSQRAYIDLQHRFRGLVSTFRSRSFKEDAHESPSATYRSGLKKLFLDARKVLKAGQFSEFLEWVKQAIASQTPEFANVPVAYEELRGVYVGAQSSSLESELRWVLERIKAEKEKINAFRHEALEVERHVHSGRYIEAIETIKDIEKEFGASFWSIQLRIAIENQVGGLERQKKYVASVRNIHRRGLLSFITYYTSVRNEERSTFLKFTDDFSARLLRQSSYNSATKTYLRYRLSFEWPTSDAGLSAILRVEQSHSIIDLYETFVLVIQEIVRRENLEILTSLFAESSPSGLSAYRLKKVIKLVDANASDDNVLIRNLAISDLLLSGSIRKSIQVLRTCLLNDRELDPWLLIYGGFSVGHLRRVREPPDSWGYKVVP